jgi:hypothetical protein
MEKIIEKIIDARKKIEELQNDNETRSREKACAITHLEEAEMWLQRELNK